jgi:YggT family protein
LEALVMAGALLRLINVLFTLYSLAIIVRSFLPLLGVDYYNPIMRFLIQITEPLLGPLRRYVPPIGGLDFTPMAALILLWVLEILARMVISALF